MRDVRGTDHRRAARVLRGVRGGGGVRPRDHPREGRRGEAQALREVGFHRELSPEGRHRIGKRGTELLRAAQVWRRTHEWPEDIGAFAREILPGLADAPPAAIAQATGLSSGYIRRVKAGDVTPHPMWWETLRQLSDR